MGQITINDTTETFIEFAILFYVDFFFLNIYVNFLYIFWLEIKINFHQMFGDQYVLCLSESHFLYKKYVIYIQYIITKYFTLSTMGEFCLNKLTFLS